jgi:flavin reductase (NADH)
MRQPGPAPFRAGIAMPESAVPRELFQQVMLLYPHAVSVITTLDSGGEPRGLTCSTVCSVSMDPPTILACLNERNGSLTAVRERRAFAVNLLEAGSSHVSNVFASGSADKYDRLAWRPSPVCGMPWLHEDALAYVECEVIADLTVGSHAILIGLVAGGHADSGSGTPLVYWNRQYGRYARLWPPEQNLAGTGDQTSAGFPIRRRWTAAS